MTRGFDRFCWIAAGLLVAVGMIKLISVFGGGRILGHSDGVFGVQRLWLYVGIGLLEVGVAGYLVWGREAWVKMALVVWLGASFVLYRAAAWWMGAGESCSCLGSALDWFPWIKPIAEPGLIGVIAYLIGGGLWFGWWQRGEVRAGTTG